MADTSLLHGWPEPIVRVQSLSESGLTAIPPRYIKPPADRPGPDAAMVNDTLPGLFGADIPTIDLTGLLGTPEQCRAVITQVSEACREWGFFQVVNHGVLPELMRAAMDSWRGFFRQPLEDKQKYANDPKTYEGYGSRLGVEKGAILDWGDYFFLHVLPLRLKEPSKWPAVPSFRDTVEEYSQEIVKLCRRLMKVMAMGLGLEADQLQEAFGGDEGVGACFRVNYYPKCPQPELTLGLSSHSDPGGLAVLMADEHVRGLQVRRSGEWVTVQPLPHAFIVNVGDQIQILTNGIYKSIEHRVLVNAELERLSIAFFYNPNGDIPLAPVPALTATSALYKPMTFNQYRLYIRERGARGKKQVESLKSSG